jgi:hypothetical protein
MDTAEEQVEPTVTLTFQGSPEGLHKLWEVDLIERLEDVLRIDCLPLCILAHIIGTANEMAILLVSDCKRGEV